MIIHQLFEFLESDNNQEWLGDDKVTVHVEKSFRLLDSDRVARTLDIIFPDFQIKHQWKTIKRIHAVNPGDATYVFDPDVTLGAKMEENGWLHARRLNCYYKIV